MVSTVWSVSCLQFFYTHGTLRAQPFVKVGARAPCAPWSRRYWITRSISAGRWSSNSQYDVEKNDSLEWKKCVYHKDDGRCWSKSVDLDEAQHLGHVTFAWTNEKQSANDDDKLLVVQYTMLNDVFFLVPSHPFFTVSLPFYSLLPIYSFPSSFSHILHCSAPPIIFC